jgi:hypothetical protein
MTVYDCRVIQGDVGVIISRDSAMEALRVLKRAWERGDYLQIFADDRSFVGAAVHELQNAVDTYGTEPKLKPQPLWDGKITDREAT